MIKVITYGTYDLLHYGHIRLLERAKALGDYLIVGVTADDFDKTRGKINVQQSLMERIEAVKKTGIADEIIVEEYEGQKIDDIKRYDVDIFTVGSDWIGKFDYLNEYCRVVYLDRTQGISSSELRTQQRELKMGVVGDTDIIDKYREECAYVNGLKISAVYTQEKNIADKFREKGIMISESYQNLLEKVDAVYIASLPEAHYDQVKYALEQGKHVLCEAPICINRDEYISLINLAEQKKLVLMEAIKTAYATAYNRLILLAKGGKIGDVVSVDVTCTSLKELQKIGFNRILDKQNSMCAWAPTALLPVLQILGVDYLSKNCCSYYADKEKHFDLFTRLGFLYPNAVASVKVGKGAKSEGELIISGTKGYIYVPAPWWKTDYFEIRYENQEENKRYFYQLDGEGIRYELVAFMKSVEKERNMAYIDAVVSETICKVIEDFNKGIDCIEIVPRWQAKEKI